MVHDLASPVTPTKLGCSMNIIFRFSAFNFFFLLFRFAEALHTNNTIPCVQFCDAMQLAFVLAHVWYALLLYSMDSMDCVWASDMRRQKENEQTGEICRFAISMCPSTLESYCCIYILLVGMPCRLLPSTLGARESIGAGLSVSGRLLSIAPSPTLHSIDWNSQFLAFYLHCASRVYQYIYISKKLRYHLLYFFLVAKSLLTYRIYIKHKIHNMPALKIRFAK